jgi:glycosyltransferase involved in cell wall biosynthesis
MLAITRELLETDRSLMHVFVGDGPLRQELDSAVKAVGLEDRVLMLGVRADVGRVLAAADVLLFASDSEGLEGMPATLIEAGLMGRPVVAADVAGVNEVVVDGETGLVADPGDQSGLRQRVRDLIFDPDRATALGAAARTRCRQRFLIEKVAPAYLRLYEGLRKQR